MAETRNYLAKAAGAPPSKPSSPSTGYPQTAVPGVTEATVPGPYWYYQVAEEIRNAILAGGLSPDFDAVNQIKTVLEKSFGRTSNGDPNGVLAANRVHERCWDTSRTPAELYVATAADGTTGGTTWTRFYKTLPGNIARSHIDGLQVSNNGTDSDHDIDVALGAAVLRDVSGNYKLFELSSVLTKQIDANWAAGNDAGGSPSALTIAASTWYHILLIGKDDGTVDAGFDTDAAGANLLADASSYSWYRRIGSVLTDGSNNITGFFQRGDSFFWKDHISDFYLSDGAAATDETKTFSVPAVGGVLAYLGIKISGSADADREGEASINPTIGNWSGIPGMVTAGGMQTTNTSGPKGHAVGYVPTDDSQVLVSYDVDSGQQTEFYTFGWTDPRGRDS